MSAFDFMDSPRVTRFVPQPSRWPLSVSGLLSVRARRRSAHEHLPPIGVFHKYADAPGVSALRLIPEDLYFRSDRQAGFCKSISKQIDRRAAFDSPGDDRAVLALHVEPDPGMGIDEFHLGDFPLQVDRLLVVVGRSKGVVRRQRRRARE